MDEYGVYVGAKILQAKPMSKLEVMRLRGELKGDEPMELDQPGYQVIYPDGYVSWSPKATFESAYRLVTEEERALAAM